MGSDQLYTRIDTLELKSLIIKKIGHRRADAYFDQLRRWFSCKISKSEFDKSCVRIIGRENIPLHNRFIRSIAKNACVARVPPCTGVKKVGSNLHSKPAHGYQRSCLQSPYGDVFPSSPRKGRSPVNRNRKFRDCPSPLGPLGKPQSVTCESRLQEQQSATELHSLGSRPPGEVGSVEDGEEVEQVTGSPGVQSRSPVTPPLGISMNLGGSRKVLSNASGCSRYPRLTCLNSGELPDTRLLRSHLEQKMDSEGMSVSVDCVNLLNNALDAYLKRLIEPCIALASSRCRKVSIQHVNSLNGTLDGGFMHKPTESVYGSMSDFLVAMNSNPHVLGEEWALQLERILLHSWDERPEPSR